MGLNTEHKGTKWEMKKKIENKIFNSFDFSNTQFNYPIFKDVQFEHCLFNKSDMTDVRLYGCSFTNCNFVNIDLRTATIGAHKGVFKDCNFDACDFRNGVFYEPEFINCTFNKCRLQKIDFRASSFDSCRFVGRMSDVTFRGNYKDDLCPDAKPNRMYNIDFSEAVFGEYVGFEDCDLSTCIPPKGNMFNEMLYVVDLNDPNHLSTGSKDKYVIQKR